VDKRIFDAIPIIVSQLKYKKIEDINAFLGFDACIDNIVRIIKDKKENSEAEFYNNSRQFGEFLISHERQSCGIEIQTQLSKIGGNMAITGNALGNLGVKADCIGTFGLPDIHPIFRSMSANCKLYTVGETITASALEFDDTKVIMFDPGPFNKLDWEVIKNHLGIDRLRQLILGKQLVALLNWSEIENSSLIWKGILDEILPSVLQSEEHPWFFADFSDCSRRSKNEIRLALALLGDFRNCFKVIISLNQNEAEIIANALNLSDDASDEGFIEMLFSACKPDELVIHRAKDAFAYDGVTFEKCDTFFCKKPKILTGGGDNFNAGYCYSKFYNFDLFQSLLVANAVSGYYVKTGTSPAAASLIDFLKQINQRKFTGPLYS